MVDQSSPIQPLAVSIDDAAVMLQRDRTTIYRMIKRGELRAVRYGGRQSIPVAQLYALTETAEPIATAPLGSAQGFERAVEAHARFAKSIPSMDEDRSRAPTDSDRADDEPAGRAKGKSAGYGGPRLSCVYELYREK